MIPLKAFIASNKNKMTTKSYNKFTEDLSHVDLKYISLFSSSFGPSTNDNLKEERLELEYYRRWLENWLGAGGNLSTLSVLYDIPLRDISEFLHVKREVISQLERQKHQMDRMADLAGKRDKTARMVDLSIQTGVLSRVVQSLGEELTEISDIEPINIDTMEVDYLTNPAFSIARVTLETTTDRGDEEKEFN